MEEAQKPKKTFLSILKNIGLVILGAIVSFVTWMIKSKLSNEPAKSESQSLKDAEESIEETKVEVEETIEKIDDTLNDASKLNERAEEVINTNTTDERLNTLETAGIIRRKK